MALYTVEGRVWAGDGTTAPCIFCGERLQHINDGGKGLCVSAIVDEETKAFLYCHEGWCEARSAATKAEPPYGPLWRCGCVADFTENVGEFCGGCHRPRPVPVPYGCGICNERITDMTAEEHYEKCPSST